LTLIALPAALFYSVLFARSIDLPVEDDYEALLDFLNHMRTIQGFTAKISYFFAAQFNEYKLFFGHAIGLIQLLVVGRVDFRILCAAGNAFVALLVLLLWRMFLPERDIWERLRLFLPVAWLLFQLCYAETLNWAMPSLQNIPVLVFALASIYLLVSDRFLASIAYLILAISASGNGLILIPIGAFVLRRQPGRLLVWAACSAGCIATYAFKYNLMSSQTSAHHSVLATVSHPHPLLALAFLGNAAALPFPLVPHRFVVLMSICLGGLILAGLAAYHRSFSRNPAVGYSVLFLLLTSLGVSGLRSGLGIAHSLDSRYKIYSVVLLALLWFAIAEKLVSRRILFSVTACAMVFAFAMDFWGWKFLGERNRRIIAGMRSYQTTGVGPVLLYPGQGGHFEELKANAPLILKESQRLGIYFPPDVRPR